MNSLGVHDDATSALYGCAGPLEEYAARFDHLFGSLAQRREFREYLAGLLAPRDRNKTLTALAGAGPRSIRRCSGCSSSCPVAAGSGQGP
jgi:hypothetical protein